jgi:hypothetical protein
VQENGCAALRNLAAVNPVNQVAIAGAGGIEVVLTAMRRHADAAGRGDGKPPVKQVVQQLKAPYCDRG